MTSSTSGRTRHIALYSKGNDPIPDFNRTVLKWLRDEARVRGHQPTAAFTPVRVAYDALLNALLGSGSVSREIAHKQLLSQLTPMLLGIDITQHISARLSASLINTSGFRTTLAQGAAKNNGENFVNAIVYAIADLLRDQDEVLVDKGAPPGLKTALTLSRSVPLAGRDPLTVKIPIECDFSIFSRKDPTVAIAISAKTRLKEVFHIATMWKMLLDTIGDEHCENKWGLTSNGALKDVTYCFATADMIPPKGNKTQGPDVEREAPRNLIAMDASFFDYVFVSKADIGHVARTLQFRAPQKEALFHELGCLIDLIKQKFGIAL
jgi:hypothetical protein